MSNDPKHPDYSHLSVSERIALAQELWESVFDQAVEIPLTEEEQQELERRWALYESRGMTTSTWPEVKQRLLAK